MSKVGFDKTELIELCWLQQMGELSSEDADRLEHLVAGNPAACDLYLCYFGLCASLEWSEASEARRFDHLVDNAMSEVAPLPAAAPIADFSGSTWHGPVGYFSSGWPVAYLVAAVIFSVGLLIGAFVHVSSPVQVADSTLPSPSSTTHYPPSTPHSTVGRITGMVDCQWSDPNTAAFSGASVPLGRKYALSSGLMEITYNTGAKVILQGPVTYEVESSAGGYLSLGKLTAKVEKNVTNLPSPGTDRRLVGRGAGGEGSVPSLHPSSFILHPLFAVRTPTAVVTDLGTEFGVEVSKEGHTTSHVFRGSVSLQVAGGPKEADVAPLVLHENESARVEQSGDRCVIVPGPSVRPADFTRRLTTQTIKTLDLVDVVAGGDGFSGKRNQGIDPTNGRPTDVTVKESKDTNPNDHGWVRFLIEGDRKYHRVETLPLLDGVFIPDGRSGPVQVDSAGHTFAEFHETANTTGQNIWAGGTIPGPSDAFPSSVSSLLSALPPSQTLVRTELGGIDYASPEHGLIFMHANSGITFDLEAIRHANPGFKLLRFRATAGNTEPLSEKGVAAVYADLWVLVDGQVRFRRREINGCSGTLPILFPVAENDRFLTLAATDGGNGIGCDWILFGDPVLEMRSVPAVRQTTPQPK